MAVVCKFLMSRVYVVYSAYCSFFKRQTCRLEIISIKCVGEFDFDNRRNFDGISIIDWVYVSKNESILLIGVKLTKIYKIYSTLTIIYIHTNWLNCGLLQFCVKRPFGCSLSLLLTKQTHRCKFLKPYNT
jgi:hypothetical protein